MRRILIRAAIALTAAFVVTVAAAAELSGFASFLPPRAGEPLVVWESSGGWCAEATRTPTCGSTTVIFRDGRWTHTDEGKRTRRGRADVTELRRAVDQLNGRESVATARPERQCASWVDGSDVRYDLRPAFGLAVRLDSCNDDVRYDSHVMCLIDGLNAREINKTTTNPACDERPRT